MPANTVYTDTLLRAVRVLGTPEALASTLGVSLQQLDRWMRGEQVLPQDMFQRAVEIVVRGQ